MKQPFITYLRISTTRQGESGLGLEAQRTSVEQYVRSMTGGAEIVREYVWAREHGAFDLKAHFAAVRASRPLPPASIGRAPEL